MDNAHMSDLSKKYYLEASDIFCQNNGHNIY